MQARLHNSFMKKVRLRSKLPTRPPRRERRKLQGTQTLTKTSLPQPSPRRRLKQPRRRKLKKRLSLLPLLRLLSKLNSTRLD